MTYKNNYVVITARCSSTRLNNKILLNINDKNKAIDIIIKRAKKIGPPVVLATTYNKSDDKLVSYVKKKYQIKIFRGSSINKLKRWFDCFTKFKIKSACMIDGDDLCFDYNMYKKALQLLNKRNFEIVKNDNSIITGTFTYILSYQSLLKTKKNFKNNTDTEMAFKFFKKAKLREHTLEVNRIFLNKKIRLTLDYYNDLLLFKLIYSIFKEDSSSLKIINFLNKYKFLSIINYDKELAWSKNIKNKINYL